MLISTSSAAILAHGTIISAGNRQHGIGGSPGRQALGLQTQRALEFFSIGNDLMPQEMIPAYGILKKAAATANHRGGHLAEGPMNLIVQACDEILSGLHRDMFPLHVWMSGSGTQFNMNVNEVISNRCCQLAGTPLGSKSPVHPNDHVNMSQSSNDTFPSAMCIAAAVAAKEHLLPALTKLQNAISTKAQEWKGIIKIWPHPLAGCHPAHSRAGMVRLCRNALRCNRAHRIRAARDPPARSRRNSGRHRNQCAPWFC